MSSNDDQQQFNNNNDSCEETNQSQNDYNNGQNGNGNGNESGNGIENGNGNGNGNGYHDDQGENTNGENGENGNSNGNHDPKKFEPEHHRKIFVGSLNYITTEDKMKEHFGKYGQILDCVIMKEGKSGKSRGFGFVTYDKSTCVDEVMKTRPHTLDSRQLEVKRATPREESAKPGSETTVKKLFVGGIKDGLTEKDLRDFFGKFGTIEDCVIMKDKESGRLRGFGFVTFDDYDPVDKIVLVDKFYMVAGQNVAVKKALPKDQEGGGQSNGPSRNGGGFNPRQQGGGRPGGNMRNGGGGGGNSRYQNNYNNRNAPNNYYDNNDFGNGGGYNNYNNNNFPNPNYQQQFGGGGSNYPGGGMGDAAGGQGMNMNNFAMFAQKMLEAAATSMQYGGANGGAVPPVAGGAGGQFGGQFGGPGAGAPINPAGNMMDNSYRGGNDYDGYKSKNGLGPMRGHSNQMGKGNRSAPYGGNKRK